MSKNLTLREIISKQDKLNKSDFNAAMMSLTHEERVAALEHLSPNNIGRLSSTVSNCMLNKIYDEIDNELCNGVTKRGSTCKKKAVKGSKYCSIHAI